MPPSNRKRFELNPAFANAHGLNEATSNADPWSSLDEQLTTADSTLTKVARAIEDARKTGKLQLSHVGLKLPLPRAIFAIREDLIQAYDGTAIDADDADAEKFWECHGEETLTVLDLSDNELAFVTKKEKKKDKKKEKDESDDPAGGEGIDVPRAVLDDRLQCYKSLHTMRIRNCHLDDLPWSILGEHLTNLSVLDAPGNRFVAVPLHLLPPSVHKLYLSNNAIRSLGDDDHDHNNNSNSINKKVIHLPQLTHLDLSNNALRSLPSTLDCANMQHLILANNKIESVPPSFLSSSRHILQTLNLTKNKLTLELDVSHHTHLQFLDLRYNQLNVIPKVHQNLSRLDVSFNQISSMEGMYEGQCNAEGIVKETGEYFRAKLTELHLEKNRFPKLDGGTLAVMTNLNLLNICQNDLENIPHVVGYLPNLDKILLDGNPLRMIRNAIKYKTSGGGGIDVEKLMESLRKKGDAPPGPGYYGSTFENQLNAEVPRDVAEANDIVRKGSCNNGVLDIGSRGLKGNLEWDALVEALMVETTTYGGGRRGDVKTKTTFGRTMKQWVLSHGKLSSFGNEWVQALPNISKLSAYRNELEKLPSNFSQFHLNALELARNRINSYTLQDQISVENSNLANALVTLDLSSNDIEWIPGCMFDLVKLESLNLSQNKLKTLEWDEDYGTGWRHGLVSLRHLDLSNNIINDLGYLPLALSGCKQLRSLLLNNNAIFRIPLELGLLTQLTNIDLLGNSQRQIRVRVLTQPCSQILKYLRDRLTPEELQEAQENHNEIVMALEEEGLINATSKSAEEEGSCNIHNDTVGTAGTHQSMNHKNNNKKKEIEYEPMSVQDQSVANVVVEEGRGRNEIEQVDEVDGSMEILDNIETLKNNINDLTEQLENLSISQAKRYALKKELAMERSKLRREERKLQ